MSEQAPTPVVRRAGSTSVGRPRAAAARRITTTGLRLPARRLADALLVVAAGAAAAVPVIVATAHAVEVGWMPGADQAIIATRAHDMFTSHMPLVGQYTTAAGVIEHATSDPGPMLYWLVAIPARFGSPASVTVTMGTVNTLAIVGCVALARRRGGLVLMFAAALAIAFMCRSLAAETFHDEWNASSGLFPLTLLIFAAWSLGCGDYRLLPLAVLLASFAAQAHLAYVAPALGLVIVGVGGLAASPPAARRSLVRWALAAVVIGCICWTPTVVDEIGHHPGNLTRVIQLATERQATVGARVGWHAVVRATGLPRPWWTYVPRSRYDRKYDVRATPSSLRTVTAIAVLAALGLVALAGLVCRRAEVAIAAVIGLVLCAALAVVAASTPTPRVMSATLGYTMWWGSQVGMWTWLTLAWSAWLALMWAARKLPRGALRVPRAATAAASVAAALLGVGATAIVARASAATESPDEHVALYRPIASLVARLDRRIPPGRTVLLEGRLDVSPMPVKPALRYFLVRHGDRVLGPDSYLRLGWWYELDHRPYDASVYVADRTKRPASHLRLVGKAAYTDGWGPHVVTVWIGPARRSAAQ